MSNASKTILSLCDDTGIWANPYSKAGYNVIKVDLKHGQDVRFFPYPGPVHGVLAQPPCTVFTRSGSWVKRTPQEMAQALSLVDACLRFVAVCRPAWWALENPPGKLLQYLGEPLLRFDPCDYGGTYTKKTCVWGSFTVPPKQPVTAKRFAVQGSWTQKLGGKTANTKYLRSLTSLAFANAFFRSNP